MTDRRHVAGTGRATARAAKAKKHRRGPAKAKAAGPAKAKAAGAAPPPSRARAAAAELLDAQRNLWKAGLEAISLGGKLAAATSGAARITESVQGGMKKLEEVFDQRVLDSLTRASMPSPVELRELMDRVAKLDAKVRLLDRRRGEK